MGALDFATGLVRESCCVCSVVFGMSKGVYDLRRQDGREFYCVNGHRQFYTETEATQLKKQLEQKEKQLVWAKEREAIANREAKHQEGRARAYKGKFTGIKRRVANGVCPCCTRSFQNLRRHMETKHPKYKKEKV